MARLRGKGKHVASGAPPEIKVVGNDDNAEHVASQPVKVDGEAPALISGGEEYPKEKEEVHNEENVKNTPKNASLGGANVAVAKDVEKPETSTKETESKKVESMGLIFMCNAKTKRDCYDYKVLGLPASKKETVAKVYKGMRLFLFDVDLRLMYGIYKAAGPGGYNIEPKAFKSGFPSQVRFTVVHDCLPLPEEKFKAVIKDNYYAKNKFDCLLNSKQVKNLCKLFLAEPNPKEGKEASSTVDLERKRRGRDRANRPLWGGEPMYPTHPITYRREAYLSPPPIAPPLPPPMYAYPNRPMEFRDRRLMDLEPPPMPWGDIERRDPYGLYHDLPAYRDPLFSAGPTPGYFPPPLYRY